MREQKRPEYDERNQDHVAALAAALGIGQLTWTVRDSTIGYATTLECRYGDRVSRRETASTRYPGYTPERRADDLRLLCADVSRDLLVLVLTGSARAPWEYTEGITEHGELPHSAMERMGKVGWEAWKLEERPDGTCRIQFKRRIGRAPVRHDDALARVARCVEQASVVGGCEFDSLAWFEEVVGVLRENGFPDVLSKRGY